MEKWLDNHKYKIMFIALIYFMWCNFQVFKSGGGIVLRLENLERMAHEKETITPTIEEKIIQNIEKIDCDFKEDYLNHTHRYYDGRIR